jgi:hypothetical protein
MVQRVQEILRKRAEQEDILRQKEDELNRHRELNRERHSLETQVKMANVERQRRADGRVTRAARWAISHDVVQSRLCLVRGVLIVVVGNSRVASDRARAGSPRRRSLRR